MKDDRIYLQHILDAIDKIQVWVKDADFDKFADVKEMLQSSVIRQIEVIGEATSKISLELRQKHSEVPWRKIIDMRNRLIHEYMSIDIPFTWVIVQEELPALKMELEKLL